VHGTWSCALLTAFRVEMLGVAVNEEGKAREKGKERSTSR